MATLVKKHHLFSQKDRTQKLVYSLIGPNDTETTIEVGVINKGDGKLILCIPSQTNCAQACTFCHTSGLAGAVAVKNLKSSDLTDIVACAWHDAEITLADRSLPLLISFMGAGEPMANVPEIITAMQQIRIWGEMLIGVGTRFAVSTMMPERHLGDLFEFMTLVQAAVLDVKLHLSLHYTTDELRRTAMPTAAKISMSLQLLEAYRISTGNPVEIHYTMIGGLNDTLQDALRLRQLLLETKTPVKFLHYNPTPGDTSRAPEAEWTAFFRSQLEDHGIPTEWYDSPGRDIAAACGMFMTDVYVKTEPHAHIVKLSFGDVAVQKLPSLVALTDSYMASHSHMYKVSRIQTVHDEIDCTVTPSTT